MALLAWTMMGLALWHFTIFLPDRFWGGIVGAFVGALVGALVVAFLINGLHVPGRHDTHLLQALEAVPGALIGVTLMWFEGLRRERAALHD
jgi:predicted ABC-type sugar transport system permease subunit